MGVRQDFRCELLASLDLTSVPQGDDDWDFSARTERGTPEQRVLFTGETKSPAAEVARRRCWPPTVSIEHIQILSGTARRGNSPRPGCRGAIHGTSVAECDPSQNRNDSQWAFSGWNLRADPQCFRVES